MSGGGGAPAVVGGHHAPVVSGGRAEHRLEAAPVDVIEFEDLFFYGRSAVIMPVHCEGEIEYGSPDPVAVASEDEESEEEEPVSPSDDDADEDSDSDEDTVPLTAIELLALAFKHVQVDSRKKLLVAGHSQAADEPMVNRALSGIRARNILYLLTGEREPWARLSSRRHLIIDYQQIMKYFHDTRGWNCNPRGCDNGWGVNTSQAIRRFFQAYNREFAVPNGHPELPTELYQQVRSDDNHKWPEEAWNAVFLLYMDELRQVLRAPDATRLTTLRGQHTFAHRQKYIACGQHCPIHSDFESSYRTDSGDRVEILFFPGDVESLHCDPEAEPPPEGRFPLCTRRNYELSFVDPAELNDVPYHVQFVYFNRYKNEWLPLPNSGGLRFKAYEQGDNELPVRKLYHDGVFALKVEDDDERTSIYFTLETTNLYVYTNGPDAEPVIRIKTPDQINALREVDRLKYYDIPAKWSSRNYWTRYQDGAGESANRFETVVDTTKHLKPYGDDITSASAPLKFSLDDIVLVGTNRNQALQDYQPDGTTAMPLDQNSHYTLFYIDHTAVASMAEVNYDGKRAKALRIHNPLAAEPVFTDGALADDDGSGTFTPRNLIYDVPGDARIVVFCGGVYDVYDKRSAETDNGFNFANGHVLGARLALLEDTDCHVKKEVTGRTADDVTKVYTLEHTGNFELHYLHNCADLDGKMLSYLLIYWSCRFETRAIPAEHLTAGVAADITNHRRQGMVNAMKRLNKDYMIINDVDDPTLKIRPFHFTEAKNDTNGGAHKCLVNIVDNTKTDGTNSGAWMSYTSSQLRQNSYCPQPTYFGATDPENNLCDTDGQTYAPQTNSHEFGHATGNWDDYLYNFVDPNNKTWSGLAKYVQPYTSEGGPFTCDRLSRMRHNRTPRMRNFWRFVNWLYDACRTQADGSDGPLEPFFSNLNFAIRFHGTNINHWHHYRLTRAQKNTYVPVHRQDNHQISSRAACDLLLYKLADGELAHMIRTDQVFKGILVVKVKYSICYENDDNDWSFNDARVYGAWLRNDFTAMLQDKFRITCDDENNDFNNIYVHFVPMFHVGKLTVPGTPAQSFNTGFSADSHYNIEVEYAWGGRFNKSGKLIEVDFGRHRDRGTARRKRIIRYTFGKSTILSSNLGRRDFSSIVSWVRTTCGDNSFNMRNL